MKRSTNNTIEGLTIELHEELCYEYTYAPNIAHNNVTPERETHEQVFLVVRLKMS